MLGRRQLLRSTAALGLMQLVPGRSVLGTQTQHARVGDDVTAFTREFGAGDQEGRYMVFGNRNDALADYWVAMNNAGGVEMVEIDFSPLPGGGLRSSQDNIGWSRFLREDAFTVGPLMLLGSLNPHRHNFHVQPWHSRSLARDLGRSGNVIVVDEDAGNSSIAEVGNWNILRTQVSMETFNVHPVNRRYNLFGPADSLDRWSMGHSLTETPDRLAYVVENPPVPGYWLLGKWVYELDISFDQPISVQASSDLIGNMLTVEGTETWAAYLPPTPNGQYGLRLNGFNLKVDGWPHYVLRYVTGTEANGTVDRIIIRAENPMQRGR